MLPVEADCAIDLCATEASWLESSSLGPSGDVAGVEYESSSCDDGVGDLETPRSLLPFRASPASIPELTASDEPYAA